MPGPVTLRSGGNVVVAVAVWVFCAVALVDGILRGTPSYILRDVLVVAAVSLAGWLVFFRPRLIVRDEGLTMINLIRTYHIPFGSLQSWKVGGTMQAEFRLEGDRMGKATSWGAPGVRKQRPALSSVMGRNRGSFAPPGMAGSANADLRSVTELAVEHREREWQRAHPQGEETVARRTWNWLPGAVLVVLILVRVAVG
ncbi:hypothetical protein [Microlunatus sp. Gsoil 973]|uniref:hypothetical protein n=1 Tax=Microlunatus sp. Gsoil 973 TaxID=2672569 RepID=UPI0012B45C35|nr:hypothetical protein [Microlunatus sp. Gsoil 973]QGN33624.1 hypothetical protein GJV80_13315 [Microlunatus sp. Gsoil 973]